MHKRKAKAEKVRTSRADTVRHSAASASTAQMSTQAPASDRPPDQPVEARSELNRAWDALLRPCPWTLLAHLTFSDRVHPEQGAKRFARWIAALEHHPSRHERGRIIWARGAEDQDRGAVHYHAVLARTTGIAPFAAMKLWERIGGGSARVVPYDATQRGVFYISKEGDVDVSATWFGDA